MSLTYGLVVCGGKSSRMGRDKSLINYHGKPQRYYLYDLLTPLCDKVIISCNEEQADGIPEEYNVLADAAAYAETGPIAALLTAFSQYPEASSYLVIGCDYPFIGREHLEALLKTGEEAPFAASYYTISDNVYEPLISLYQREIYPILLDHFNNKNYSLRRVLEEVHSIRIFPDSKELIKSVDTPEEYKKAVDKISQRSK